MKINAKNGFDIRFIKNNTYALLVTFKDIEEDLRSAFFTVKENPEDTTPVLQKTLGAGIFKVDDRAYKKEKKYKVQIQAEDTSNLEAEVQYLYDLQVMIDNVVKTVASGLFVVSPTITGDKTIATTEDIIAEVTDELDTDLETTAPTAGVEYETDPVAMAKIGDMATLNTENKETLVKAISEVKAQINAEKKTRAEAITKETTARENGDTAIRNDLQWGTLKPKYAGDIVGADGTPVGAEKRIDDLERSMNDIANIKSEEVISIEFPSVAEQTVAGRQTEGSLSYIYTAHESTTYSGSGDCSSCVIDGIEVGEDWTLIKTSAEMTLQQVTYSAKLDNGVLNLMTSTTKTGVAQTGTLSAVSSYETTATIPSKTALKHCETADNAKTTDFSSNEWKGGYSGSLTIPNEAENVQVRVDIQQGGRVDFGVIQPYGIKGANHYQTISIVSFYNTYWWQIRTEATDNGYVIKLYKGTLAGKIEGQTQGSVVPLTMTWEEDNAQIILYRVIR